MKTVSTGHRGPSTQHFYLLDLWPPQLVSLVAA